MRPTVQALVRRLRWTSAVLALSISNAGFGVTLHTEEYAGIYAAGPLATTEIAEIDSYVAAVPPYWGSRPYLVPVKGTRDRFAFMIPSFNENRTITFKRDSSGKVVALELSGVDRSFDGKEFKRLAPGARTPETMFMDHRPEDAANAALADKSITMNDLRDYALRHFINHPTRIKDTIRFIERVRSARPDDSGLESIYGYALVAAGRRDDARSVLKHALELDPKDELAREASRRLALKEPAKGEGYRKLFPFNLAEAFAKPTREELSRVRTAWSARDLSARDVQVIKRAEAVRSSATYDVSIVRHRMGGYLHYGAVWVPRNVAGPLPVLLDARGVNPTFTPMDVTEGTDFLNGLREHQEEFIVVVPAMNGHKLIFQGEEYPSEGDPSDSWDGATDATLALLNAALSVTPEADASRIAIYGHSRGGTVAYLAAERDPRITLVLSVAGPVDHFEAMQPYPGFRWEEILTDDMSDGEPPAIDDESGQKYDQFFHRVVTEGESLDKVRQRMVASSPLYFLETLPETYGYFGSEDRSVPLANALALKERAKELRLENVHVAVFEGRGHDTDPYLMQRDAIKRLTAWAKKKRKHSLGGLDQAVARETASISGDGVTPARIAAASRQHPRGSRLSAASPRARQRAAVTASGRGS